ncbi:MAG: toll/interleukin-1 receptor domain-containing protein [Myxococcaceae bacterium]|nr:toll/interleukin-1 receptor domain-containing protein [Myxococcaceae bacterium]
MAPKKRLWVTYAWADNADQDVDYILKKLENSGELEVHFDRRQLPAGQRLWDNIEQEIINPDHCDAYAIVVTPDSLASGPCKEELAYALERALSTRGSTFPLIPLIYKIEPSKMPPRLKIRLGVMLREPNWVTQVVAAANSRPMEVDFGELQDWKLRVHRAPAEENCVFVLEVQPRLETIPSWLVAFPASERVILKKWGVRAPKSPFGGIGMMTVIDDEVESSIGPLRVVGSDGTPLDYSHSLYLFLDALPSQLLFSRDGGRNLAPIDLSTVRPSVP